MIAKRLDNLLTTIDDLDFFKFTNYDGKSFGKDKEVLDWMIENKCIIRGFCITSKTGANIDNYYVRAYVGRLYYDFLNVHLNTNNDIRREYLTYLVKHTHDNVEYAINKNFENYEEACSHYHHMINETTGAYSDGSYAENNLLYGPMSTVNSLSQLDKKEAQFKAFLRKLPELFSTSRLDVVTTYV